MTPRHIDQEELALFVVGGLDEVRAAEAEAHVRDCASCAARLQREAQLEDALGVVARRAELAVEPARRRLPGRRALTAGLAGCAAVAVVVALALSRDQAPTTRKNSEALVIVCPGSPNHADCVTQAHQRGLMVSYPPSEPPRYEELPSIDDAAPEWPMPGKETQ